MKNSKSPFLRVSGILSVVFCLVFGAACSSGDSKADDSKQKGEDGGAKEDGGEDEDGGDKEKNGDEKGEGIFAIGCPTTGKAFAKIIEDEGVKMEGPDAIGGKGDYLIYNSRAAFIIQGAGHTNSYYPYGGILIDAAPVEGCRQAALEQFEELGFFVATMNLGEYYQSILRAFRGESVEIISDGKEGGKAIVRVTGVDDYYWTAETQLIREAALNGVKKPRSEPFGIKIVVDYILSPDSNVLEINVNYTNKNDKKKRFTAATELMFGNTTTLRYYSDTVLDIAGYTLDQEVPWLSASNGAGAWAFAEREASLAVIDISGVTAFLNVNQLLKEPISLAPAGEENDAASTTYFFAVGPTDSNSAVKHFQEFNPQPMPGKRYELTPIKGRVIDEASGEAIVGALVELQAQNTNEEWRPLDSFYTNKEGAFSGEIPKFVRRQMPYRLVASINGRQDAEPVGFVPGEAAEFEIKMKPGGVLNYDIRNESGVNVPAKLLLWQGNRIAKAIYSTKGVGEEPVTPGEYEYTVSRGYEYTLATGTIKIESGSSADISADISRVVNTAGYLSVDTHVHAQPSPDNLISIPERIATVAAEGLEVVVSTDHEFVNCWKWGVEETGLEEWVATVVGQEVTAPIPEHTNMYPVEPRYDINARGGYIEWYGLDIAEIYAAERARGAKITQLNHPRQYLPLIQYDPLTGEAGLDPTYLGYDAGAKLWDWNFNAMELMNDPEPMFAGGSEAPYGLFDYWMSFINLGHKITAVGVSDAHDYALPGRPRNYYISSTDLPSEFDEDEFVNAIIEGRSLISAGAFAEVRINDSARLGDTITDTSGETKLSLRIEAIPEVDIQYFKVYVNCDQALTAPAQEPEGVIKYEGEVKIPISEDSHIVVMGFGEKEFPRAFKNYNPNGIPRFVSNPIYVDFDGNGKFDPPGGKLCNYDLQGL